MKLISIILVFVAANLVYANSEFEPVDEKPGVAVSRAKPVEDNMGDNQFPCKNSMPGNCAENTFQETRSEMIRSNKGKYSRKLEPTYHFNDAIVAIEPKIYDEQLRLQKWAKFKGAILSVMQTEADIPEKFFSGGQLSLFSPDEVARAFLEASSSDVRFANFSNFLSSYQGLLLELHKDKQAIDVKKVWNQALYKSFERNRIARGEQPPLPEAVRGDVEQLISSRHYFESSVAISKVSDAPVNFHSDR